VRRWRAWSRRRPARPPERIHGHLTSPRGATIDPFDDPIAEGELRETTVDSRVVHRGRTLVFRVDTIERADGSRHQREIVGHPGAVAIVAIDDAGRVLLVRQFRTAAGRTLLEIPAGTLDVDETTGAVEDPDLAAARELEEETGQRAAQWRKLGAFWTAPGFATELMHLYLATGLSPAGDGRLDPDEDEALVLARVPLDDALAATEDGRIADAKSIVGLLRYARIRDRETPPRSDGSRVERA
jgi:ADP-ribose pyrophosphatase